MTGICRVLVLVLVAAGVFLGVPASAQAAFGDSTTTATVTISTVTVAAPTNVVAQLVDCGSNGRWQDVRLTWTPSATDRVSGYRVTIHQPNGSVVASSNFGASTTIALIRTDKLSSVMTLSVTTRTSYGWTKESTRTGALPC